MIPARISAMAYDLLQVEDENDGVYQCEAEPWPMGRVAAIYHSCPAFPTRHGEVPPREMSHSTHQ